jgi:hypothetical protein
MRISDAPFVPSWFGRVISRELLRKNEVLVYLSGVKKSPHYRRRLLTFRIFGLSKLNRESRRADSKRFPAPVTSLLAYILARTGASGLQLV